MMRVLAVLSAVFALSWAYNAENASWIPQIRNGLPSNPTVREFHSFTYIKNATNEEDARAVLFGGVTYNGTTYNLNDTWVIQFPNETWTQVNTTSGPAARAYHSACAHNGQVIVFGGRNESSGYFNDVWRFDVSTLVWKKDDDSSSKLLIQARASHSSAIVHNKLYVFGGYVPSLIKLANDLWSYSLEDRVWTQVFADGTVRMPPARQGASLTSINGEIGQSLVLFGGYTGIGGFNDLWQYFEFQSKWVMIYDNDESTAPPRRTAHTAIGGRSGNVSAEVVIYGGFFVQQSAIPYYSDVWSVNITASTAVWKNLIPDGLTTGPGKRGGHATVHAKNRSYTFGGYVQYSGFYNDLWLLEYDF